MKINPIKTFSYKNNTLKINESTFKYSGEVDNEVLESLISKRAYATTLLYLNSTCNLESINEKEVSKQELSVYLDECMNLLESRSKLIESIDAKPLCNINKLELMEDSKNIYRGKAGKMYVELTEDVLDLANFKNDVYNALSDVAFKYNDITKDLEVDMYKNLIEDSFKWFMDKFFEDNELDESTSLKEDSYEEPFFAEIEDALLNAGFDVQRFSEAGILTQSLGWCVSNSEGEVQLQCNGTYLSEEAEGTQTTDVAEKKDQELGTIKPKKTSKFIATESTFNVPYDHGFKGFTLTEDGKYTRGNYVLINEKGSIKAVRKANIIDDYGDYVWDYSQVQEEQAPRLIADMNRYFNKNTNTYDFGFRIEDNQLKIYDANEEFDFSSMDDKLELANKLLRNLFGKNAYFEAELSPIGVVAGIIIKDLN